MAITKKIKMIITDKAVAGETNWWDACGSLIILKKIYLNLIDTILPMAYGRSFEGNEAKKLKGCVQAQRPDYNT